MKKVKTNQLKTFIFTAVKISLYVAWTCFRNGLCPGSVLVVIGFRICEIVLLFVFFVAITMIMLLCLTFYTIWRLQ